MWCPACQRVPQVRLDFADPRRSFTRASERYALELCGYMTVKDVVRHLNMGWDLIKNIQMLYLQ